MANRLGPQTVYTMELSGYDDEGLKTMIRGNVRMVQMRSDGWGGVGMSLEFVPDNSAQLYSVERPVRVSKHYTKGA